MKIGKRTRRSAVRRSTAAVVVLALFTFGIYRYLVHRMVTAPNADETPPDKPRDGEHFFASPIDPPVTIAYEIASADKPDFTVFVLHGLHDSRGSMMPWAKAIADANGRAIAIDARGHGRSTGKTLSYGVRESQDYMKLTDELVRTKVALGKLGVLGFSTGAATAIQWAGRDPRLEAVVAVAPFEKIIDVSYYVKALFPRFFLERVIAQGARESGFDPSEGAAGAWIDKTRALILILHGTNDRRVDPDSSKALFERAPKGSERILLENETHASSLKDANEAGRKKAREWFEKRLR